MKIGVLMPALVTAYPAEIVKEMKKIAGERNATLQFFNAGFDPVKQVSQCQDAITTQQFQALIIGPASSPNAVPCARAAAAAKIPLVSFNGPVGSDYSTTTPRVPGVVGQVFTPPAVQEAAMANSAVKFCQKIKPCRVGLIVGPLALIQETVLVQKVKQAVAAHPNMTLVGTVQGDFSSANGQAGAQNLIQKTPNINVIVAGNDDIATGVLSSVKAAGKQPTKQIGIVAQGGSTVGIAGVRAGNFYSSAPTYAQAEADTSMDMALRAARGQTIAQAGVDGADVAKMPHIIDQSNIQQFPSFKGQY